MDGDLAAHDVAGVPAGTRPRMGVAMAMLRVFGYGSFRGQQQEVIGYVMAGATRWGLVPTGDEPLCSQVSALVRADVGVVVSPLSASGARGA